MRTAARVGALALTVGFVHGCDEDLSNDDLYGSIDPEASTGAEGTSSGGGSGDDSGAGEPEPDDGPPSPIKFDAGGYPDGGGNGYCAAPPPVVCDDEDDDPWHAMGLNCDGGAQVTGTMNGHANAFHVHAGNLGTHMPAPFPPRQGDKMLIMSSGVASDMAVAGRYASTAHSGHDPGTLPAPIFPTNVGAQTCAENPDLVAADGDCSNTIQTQWDQGSGANDYAEVRFTATVPSNTFGFSYDFAMFSTEYPVYYGSTFNDMYIAWLESEQWTGNVSFDEMGNPISLNAGFLDYKDASNPIDCAAGCTAPELAGTAMEGHAGTKWLTTSAPVTPGEEIEVVFAVFDLTDNNLDTVVLLDNWHWSCDGGPPITIPG